jgi:hypothetical protein
MFQSVVSLLHSYGSVVRQKYNSSGVYGRGNCSSHDGRKDKRREGEKEGERKKWREVTEGSGDKLYPSRHTPSDKLPSSMPQLLIAHSAMKLSMDSSIDEVITLMA